MKFNTLAARDTKSRDRLKTERNAKTPLKSKQIREKPGKSVHGVFGSRKLYVIQLEYRMIPKPGWLNLPRGGRKVIPELAGLLDTCYFAQEKWLYFGLDLSASRLTWLRSTIRSKSWRAILTASSGQLMARSLGGQWDKARRRAFAAGNAVPAGAGSHFRGGLVGV
jgi:hypothetical protein